MSVIGDIASCICGDKSCRGQGAILQGSSRNIMLDGRIIAMTHDPVDTGCGNCFVLSNGDKVSLGEKTSTGIYFGSGVNIGDGVHINIGNVPSQAASRANQVVSSAKVPEINPNNMYWPPYNFLTGEVIKVEYLVPPKSLAIFSIDEAKEFLQNLYNDMGGKNTISSVKSYKDLGSSGKEAIEIAKGLGGLGVKAYTKNINGRDWIIIKDYKKHLKILEEGHKWKANNPRIIQLGLGLNDLKGSMRYVRFNAGLEIAFSVGLNAVDYILRDEATLVELGVNSAADITKGFISLFGAAVITATFPISLTAMGSMMLFAIASFAIGYGLDSLDDETGFQRI